MKTKSLFKKALAGVLIIVMTFAISTTALATVNKDKIENIVDFAEALQEIGLSVDVDILSERNNLSSIGINNMPHIGRISQDVPVRISSEEDIELLLAFAQLLSDNQIPVFSWDTCVDDAIAEAGLEHYWRTGFKEITYDARKQDIFDLSTSHTLDELHEMGVFDRPEMADEIQALGLFSPELIESYKVEAATIQSGSYYENIPLTILQPTGRWRGNIPLWSGDSVSYTITYVSNVEATATTFATGMATGTQQGVSYGWVYYAAVNTQTSSRTFNIVRAVGNEFFGIQPTGRTDFTISGLYYVIW